MRNNQAKAKGEIITIVSASYVKDFLVALKFNTGEERLVDFLPLFHTYVKGSNLKYFSIGNFKKFIVKNGNIYWGQNEDVIFSLDKFYNLSAKDHGAEEVLFVI